MAVQKLLDAGAKEQNIIFVNVVAAPEGIAKLLTAYPRIKLVTASISVGLNAKRYIRKSVGDYGDRYVGTTTLNDSNLPCY